MTEFKFDRIFDMSKEMEELASTEEEEESALNTYINEEVNKLCHGRNLVYSSFNDSDPSLDASFSAPGQAPSDIPFFVKRFYEEANADPAYDVRVCFSLVRKHKTEIIGRDLIIEYFKDKVLNEESIILDNT